MLLKQFLVNLIADFTYFMWETLCKWKIQLFHPVFCLGINVAFCRESSVHFVDKWCLHAASSVSFQDLLICHHKSTVESLALATFTDSSHGHPQCLTFYVSVILSWWIPFNESILQLFFFFRTTGKKTNKPCLLVCMSCDAIRMFL